ncbi:MAG: hypothetical protein BMS9Abin07_1152 [Acidimicrobiia bacterium]|nr:MAG: hypothetical protein BMS9Abin07_1152 [Acidimicrobiia bacterium]
MDTEPLSGVALPMERSREQGAVLVLMAIFLAVVMGAAAMAVDLGWLFWQSLEIQHGADTAALAGVVFEPDKQPEAHTEAIASALENGYDDGLPGTTVTVSDSGDLPLVVANETELRVTITHQVNTFFMKIFGLAAVDISRTAVAQYTPPLLMGSPSSTFGRDFSKYAPGDPSDPGFWASISGTYGPASWGDRHASPCKDKTYIDGTYYGYGFGLEDVDGNDCIIQDDYRDTVDPGTQSASGGYLYGMVVEPGTSGISVDIFDGPLFAQGNYSPSTADRWTGDFWPDPSSWGRYESFGPPDLDITPYFATYFMLYGPDTTPLNTDDNELLCVVKYSAYNDSGDNSGGRDGYFAGWDPNSEGWESFDDVLASSTGGPSYIAGMWDSMASSAEKQPGCLASFDRGPGVYPLRVMVAHDEPSGCPGYYAAGGCPYALNKYSLRMRATTGADPTISALTDMSIFANDVAWASTEFYLAKIEQTYAGKDLIVELWDAGDFGGDPNSSDTVEVIAGNGDTLTCSWVEQDLDGNEDETGSTCSFDMKISGGGSKYDNRIIKFTIPLPETYACSGDACWFRVEYNYTGSAAIRDVTTWTAYIEGSPIRIVE